MIIKDFGFSSLNTTLLAVPYTFIILFSNLAVMYLQSWIPGQQRSSLIDFAAIAGTGGIRLLPKTARGGLLAC